MTIKKRLFLSNILMIVIPACLGVLAVAAALLLFLTVLLPQSGSTWLSQYDMAETRSELVSLAEDWLSEADPAQQTALAARLEKTAAAHQMVLVIRQDGGEAGRFGQGAATDQPGLTQALAALEGSGTVSDGTTDLFGAVYSAGGVTYQLEVYSQGVVTDLPHQTEHLAATLLAAAVVMVLAAVLVTNRFLTRFVFRHIQEPLETLAEGVHQIRDGNLTHRIAYDSRDEFQPVCEDFNDMAQRLRASVEQSQREEASRKELLASISHDIRSPLTAIQAYVEGLLDGVADTPEKQREYLTILQAKATEMDQLVRKIFLFSKMDLGEYPYSPEPLDPAQEVAAVVAASREAYRQRGLSITVEPLPTGCQVLADPIYFHSILTNLLDNSAKYKDKATGQVTITGAVEGQDFCLTVDDDGPGVPPEALPRLFDVFYRNDPARKNPDQGSGLGLAIVAKSMERMGGTIRAENRPQGGCGWCCASPRRKERWTMKRILIVEDDGAIAAIERDYLMLSDFQVDIAATGPEGLAMGRSGGDDLILLDLMLPGLDGFALCSTLRETLDIPILMVTARQEDIDKIKGLGLGADDYITKPFSPSVLVARIKAHLAQYGRLKQAGGVDRNQLQLGSVLLQKDARRVFVDGAEVALKNKEYELLLFLLSNPDIVFSEETLYERIWGYDAMGDNATEVVHINRLREKIEKDPSHPRYIQTVWGAGYRFKP